MELGQPLKRHTVIPVRHNMPASEPSSPSSKPQPSKAPISTPISTPKAPAE